MELRRDAWHARSGLKQSGGRGAPAPSRKPRNQSSSMRQSASHRPFSLSAIPCIVIPMQTRKRRGRQRHYDLPGHAHELTFSCFHGFPFLRAERTCRWLADSIEKARTTLDFAVWAYVFMPDHAHLLICPRRPDYRISDILKAIKSPVSRVALAWLRENSPDWLERIRAQRGKRVEYHFWQSGGGYDRNVDEPRTLRSMIEYIHLNPVRKGLVRRAVDWNWSSAAWFQTNVSTCLLIPDRIPPEWAA